MDVAIAAERAILSAQEEPEVAHLAAAAAQELQFADLGSAATATYRWLLKINGLLSSRNYRFGFIGAGVLSLVTSNCWALRQQSPIAGCLKL